MLLWVFDRAKQCVCVCFLTFSCQSVEGDGGIKRLIVRLARAVGSLKGGVGVNNSCLVDGVKEVGGAADVLEAGRVDGYDLIVVDVIPADVVELAVGNLVCPAVENGQKPGVAHRRIVECAGGDRGRAHRGKRDRIYDAGKITVVNRGNLLDRCRNRTGQAP